MREAIYLGDRLVFMSGTPGRVVLDLLVDLPSQRLPEDPDVERFRHNLLEHHPRLLAGLIEDTESVGNT